MSIAIFNKFTFSYKEKVVIDIDDEEYFEVYNDVIIMESTHPKYKKDDVIEQISIQMRITFEHLDGSPMN